MLYYKLEKKYINDLNNLTQYNRLLCDFDSATVALVCIYINIYIRNRLCFIFIILMTFESFSGILFFLTLCQCLEFVDLIMTVIVYNYNILLYF